MPHSYVLNHGCDDVGFEGDISEKPGINSVESGGTFEKSYQIIVG